LSDSEAANRNEMKEIIGKGQMGRASIKRQASRKANEPNDGSKQARKLERHI